MGLTAVIIAVVAATAQAAKDERTFAVLRFYGDGPMMEGRVDPIVSPGQTSSHVHTVQGGSNFGTSATGEDLMNSSCSSALVEGDNSAYWVPKLYFNDKTTGMVEDVPLYYMNVYYFFEPTDDDVVAFPVGLQMVSGNAMIRDCPDFQGENQLDAGNAAGTQPLQWTCPRSSYSPASWASASASNGSTEGIQDPYNQQSGQGFPFADCDGEYSPLRQDIHFPSCYDPSKDLTDYQNNMVFPTTVYDGYVAKQNCPKGFVHVPHLFYEAYWNTIDFKDRWTPNQGEQPFVLANGDLSGCSGHGDFLAAWDTTTLQHIIDTCNAGDPGMNLCPGITVRDQSKSCNVASPVDEIIKGNLSALPGHNPLTGWGMSEGSSNPATSVGASASASASATESGSSATGVSSPAVVSSAPASSAAASSDAESSAAASSTATASVESSAAAYPTGSPSEEGDTISTTTTSTPSKAPYSSSMAAVHTTMSTVVSAAVDVVPAASAPATTVTTLANGRIVTTTVVDWITTTKWVTQDVPVATETVQAHMHVHNHAHLLRHRSPHHRRR